jgi:hypothetical protein
MFNISAQELIKIIENSIDNGDYKDAVHKIKLMTTREMILEILSK